MISRGHRYLLIIIVAALLEGVGVAQGRLGPTAHAPVPAREADVWLVPPGGRPASQALADAVRAYERGQFAEALALLTRVPAAHPLADYAAYYRGQAQFRLKQADAAEDTLDAVLDRQPPGALALSAALALGEVEEADGDHRDAMAIYQRLAADKQVVNEEVLSRLGRAALAAGDRKTAAEAYVRVYYEFALTDAATAAASHLAELRDHVVRTGYAADLGRATMLFGARRYAEARSAFQDVQKQASGDDRTLASLRVAECDFRLQRFQAARDALRAHLDGGPHRAEARFFYLSALRELNGHDQFVSGVRAMAAEFPDSPWTEEALNALGTHFILTNQDPEAAAAFADLYEKFPTGTHAERAAWKAGWWSYRQGDFPATVRVFERAAATFPRSNYRPSYLYWAGRAHAKAGDADAANARFRLVYADYGNSYYGRLARKRAGRAVTAPPDGPAAADAKPAPATPPPTADRIRHLLAHAMYDDALAELRHAQRAWGNSPVVEATMAWAYHQKGELRRAITLMRRAYPQSLTADGHDLPIRVRQVLFPLVYWELIRKHSQAHDLDPYVVAALIGQESTFQPDARSVANAIGLMQIVPPTGRRLAQSLKIRRFTPALLTRPEVNIRLGTLHFSRLVQQFGGAHFALASYNAGENRVVRWKAERPGLEEDEFIDDIPFPETQNYVKRILGTAEDYRLLYGKDGGRPQPPR